jgi:resuscitation-promoting factor RpfB
VHRSAKLCLYAIVLGGIVAGAVSIVHTDKSVTVSIDGRPRSVHTSAGTVAGVLHDVQVSVGGHDVVAPALPSRVRSGSLVEVRRGRLLHLTVDGVRRDVWTTDLTVDQALADLGYGTSRTVGVSRSKRLPLTPTDLTVILPKHMTIKVDGRRFDVITTAATVRDAVLQAHIRLGPDDRLVPDGALPPTAGLAVTVRRVRHHLETVTKSIPYSTKTTKDSSKYQGTTEVLRSGRSGTARVRYELVYVDGKLSRRVVLATTVLKAPVSQLQVIGTKSPESGSPAAARLLAKSMVAARGWDDSQYQCLVLLWNKESGWRTDAYNPSGAYGIPQALPGSKMASAGPDWQSNAHTQIAWGLGYIASRYSTPCGAWAHSQATNWYVVSPR